MRNNNISITPTALRHAFRVRRLLMVVFCGLAIALATASSAAAAINEVKLEGTGTGTVTSEPSGIDCTDIGGGTSGECATSAFLAEEHIELTATAGPESQFEGWQGGANTSECESGTANPCGYSTGFGTSPREITAIFGFTGPKLLLTVTLTGTGGGEVTSSPKGIECGTKCEAEFGEGSTVALTAKPIAHSTFAGWIGCNSVNAEYKCEVTMSAAKSVEAKFDAIPQKTLEVHKTGAGSGEVTSSPSGIECGTTCSYHFDEDSTVILTATPAAAVPGARYAFGGWIGCSAVTSEEKCEVTMSEAKTVEAKFDTIPQQTLKVQESGTGSGDVTSSPPGISCGGGTCEAEFDEGATVTLTAASSSESFFAGWSGACSGTGSCELALTAATTVTATFEPVPPPAASTGEATQITQTTAMLTGMIDGQGFDTHYFFDYGETASLGSQAPSNRGGEDAGAIATNTPEIVELSGLTPDTTYHYEVVVFNVPCVFYCPPSGANIVAGAEQTFTTLALAPVALADPPTNLGANSATLTGSFNPQGVVGTYYFEYGTTTNYGTSSPDATVAAANTGIVVSANTLGLAPNTTYHYRLVVANNGGVTVADSPEKTFTTYAAGEPNTAPPLPGFSLTGTAPTGPLTAIFTTLTGVRPLPPSVTVAIRPARLSCLQKAERLRSAIKRRTSLRRCAAKKGTRK